MTTITLFIYDYRIISMKEIYKLLMVSTITIILTMTVTIGINFASALKNTTPSGECSNGQGSEGNGPGTGSIASGDTIDTGKGEVQDNPPIGTKPGLPEGLPDAGDALSNPETPPSSCLPQGGTSPLVTGLAGSSKTSTQINLFWNPSTDPNLSQYYVYMGTSAGFSVIPGVTIPVGTSAAGTSISNSYSVTGLNPSTTYYFKVASVDKEGNISPLSSEISVKTKSRAQDIISGTTSTLSSGIKSSPDQ
jgi:hypothetical protein